MAFKRTIEDFTCEKCGAHVAGDGYTDHCPQCLWSKHVDVQPGDRTATCHGAMRPMAVEGGSPDYVIRYACEKCAHPHRVKAHPSDSADALIALAAAHAAKS